jgi:predicted RNase H-like nuclease (RuvC/YqgF family)
MGRRKPSKKSLAHQQAFVRQRRERRQERQKEQVLALVEEMEVEHKNEIERFSAYNAALGREVGQLTKVNEQNLKHIDFLNDRHTQAQIRHNKNYNEMVEKLGKMEWELKDKKEKLEAKDRIIRNLRRAITEGATKIADLEGVIHNLRRGY